MNDYQPPSGPPHQPQGQTNGTSVAALVLGILGIVVPFIGIILAIIAIVLGHQSKKAIRALNQGGYGMAMAGFVLGIIGTCIWGLYYFFIFLGLATFYS